jgi:hypothetical protein
MNQRVHEVLHELPSYLRAPSRATEISVCMIYLRNEPALTKISMSDLRC